MTIWTPHKNKPLYAPMLATFGGGSIRGFKGAGLAAFNVEDLNAGWDSSGFASGVSPNLTTPVQTGSHPYDAEDLSGVRFKPDGTKFYVLHYDVRSGQNAVYEWDMSTAFDITTASFNQKASFTQSNFWYGIMFKPDGAKMFLLGTDNVREFTLSTAWDISTASLNNTFNVGGSIGGDAYYLRGMFIGDSGTKLYVDNPRTGVKKTYQFNLSTAWDVSTAPSSPSKTLSHDLSDQTMGMAWKSDGTKWFKIGNNYIWSFNLTTAWDISTSSTSYDDRFYLRPQSTTAWAADFKPDGSEMFMVSRSDFMYKYNLSTGWDVTTMSAIAPTVGYKDFVGSGALSPNYHTYKSDGTRLYIFSNSAIFQYALSTAWDFASATYTTKSPDFAVPYNNVGGFKFNSSGTKVFLNSAYGGQTYGYNLSTAWDVSTISAGFTDTSKYMNSLYTTFDYSPRGFAIDPSGTKVFNYMGGTKYFHEVNLSTAWDVSTMSVGTDNYQFNNLVYTFNFMDSGNKLLCTGTSKRVFIFPISTAYDVSTMGYPATNTQSKTFSTSDSFTDSNIQNCLMNTNGTQLYLFGYTEVFKYTLSTAYDLSTASFVSKTTIYTGAGTALNGKSQWGSSGNKLYFWYNDNGIYEYNLSTAYDASTLSYHQKIELPAKQLKNMGGTIHFKPDGTKLLVYSTSHSKIFSISLSTAWDISTATVDLPTSNYLLTYDKDKQSGAQANAFNNDGTKYYVIGNQSKAVYQYNLSTAYDIATATYNSSFDVDAVRSGILDLQDISFTESGSKMHILTTVGSSDYTGAIHNFSLSTPYQISTASYDNTYLELSELDDENVTNITSMVVSDEEKFVSVMQSSALYKYEP